jgi:hypothetical protein
MEVAALLNKNNERRIDGPYPIRNLDSFTARL